MPALVRGRVGYPKTPIPDPQGQNPKGGRPFVVISRDDDIKRGGTVQLIGITSELMSSPEDHYVLLPFGPNAKTGLKSKSAALCSWLVEISAVDLEISRGYIHPDLVEQIVRLVLQLKSIPPAAPPAQSPDSPAISS